LQVILWASVAAVGVQLASVLITLTIKLAVCIRLRFLARKALAEEEAPADEQTADEQTAGLPE
jgi:hypothetical protein